MLRPVGPGRVGTNFRDPVEGFSRRAAREARLSGRYPTVSLCERGLYDHISTPSLLQRLPPFGATPGGTFRLATSHAREGNVVFVSPC